MNWLVKKEKIMYYAAIAKSMTEGQKWLADKHNGEDTLNTDMLLFSQEFRLSTLCYYKKKLLPRK